MSGEAPGPLSGVVLQWQRASSDVTEGLFPGSGESRQMLGKSSDLVVGGRSVCCPDREKPLFDTQNPGVSGKGKDHCQGPTGGTREGDTCYNQCFEF